jgi:hypothetical protein
MSQKPTPCRFLRLPYFFEEERLVQDLSICREEEWKRHFNTNVYTGEWTSIALYSASGNATDIMTDSGSGFHPTTLALKCDYFREVIDTFECEKESVRLLLLAPGAIINEHRDIKLAYEYGSFRLHIPVITGEAVDFTVDGTDLRMKNGECWYANFDLTHRVNNRGEHPRVHLVIDCKRNEWSDKMFADAGYDFDAEKRMMEPDPETRQRIMDELLRINSDASIALAEQMKAGAGGGTQH